MATLAQPTRAIAPFDVSDVALFVDDTWREPFAQLRAEMPVSWCAESPYGGYWSVACAMPSGIRTRTPKHWFTACARRCKRSVYHAR